MNITVRTRVAMRFQVTPSLSINSEIVTFTGLPSQKEHFAVLVPPLSNEPLVRVHSECMTGDVFGSTRCDCGDQLVESLERFSLNGGVLLYMRQEGRGIGLYEKLDAYVLQSEGIDTFEANRMLGFQADERDFSECAEMLRALDIPAVQLLTNNTEKRAALEFGGIEVAALIPTRSRVTPENRNYLSDKARLAGHTLALEGGSNVG